MLFRSGLAIVGWGVVQYHANRFAPMAYGSIQTKAGEPVEDRLQQIYNRLCDIIMKYKPDAIAVEELFWNTNVTTGIVVAEARGVILLCARMHGIPIYDKLQSPFAQVEVVEDAYKRCQEKEPDMILKQLHIIL